jgi:ubiquinone/menaquinone biosynthesis C-methylase UbiE
MLTNSLQNAVADYWSKRMSTEEEEYSSDTFWLAIPEVRQRYDRKATDNSYCRWFDYCLRFLKDTLPVERMLSIGCGTGALERKLARRQAFCQCDAYDLAPGAIALARRRALAEGYDHIHYQTCDANRLQLEPANYDAVWFDSSLHHIEALEEACAQVARSLKPGGFIFINEYIGPNRFDFPSRQKEVLQAAFMLIPRHYRRYFGAGNVAFVPSVGIPDPKAVEAADPSEAVRSADIMQVLEQHFEILACHETGGTILQYVLNNIAGNFKPEIPGSMRVLEMLFAIEDTLMDVGDLASDFAVVVGRPRR